MEEYALIRDTAELSELLPRSHNYILTMTPKEKPVVCLINVRHGGDNTW